MPIAQDDQCRPGRGQADPQPVGAGEDLDTRDDSDQGGPDRRQADEQRRLRGVGQVQRIDEQELLHADPYPDEYHGRPGAAAFGLLSPRTDGERQRHHQGTGN